MNGDSTFYSRKAAKKKTMPENEITKNIVDAAYHIHRKLGLGLLESVYEVILAYTLNNKVLKVERQLPVPIFFDGI